MGGTSTIGTLLGPEGTGVGSLSLAGPVCGGLLTGVGGRRVGAGGFARCLRTAQWTRASLLIFCGQVFKGIRWMPWHQEPMKDVGACDNPRGAGNRALIRGCPNGETRLESFSVTCT
jgi:hypothetical protein